MRSWVVLAGVLLTSSSSAAESATTSATVVEGPWGRLETIPIRIRLPDEMVPDRPLAMQPWVFGHASAGIRDALQTAGVEATLVDRLMASYDPAGGGLLRPSAELSMQIAPESRAALYEALRKVPGRVNFGQHSPHKFSRERLDLRFREVAPETRRMLESFLYDRGSVPGSRLLADLPALTRLVTDREERRRLIQAASEQDSLLLRLRIDASTDAAALAAYWGRGGRRRDLEILITSLKAQDGGYDLDAIYLLPPFARSLLFSYPLPENALKRDCFWTALNFFLPVPDDSLDGPALRRTLDERYERVTGEPLLGDILVLLRPSGEAEHAAIYIAGDVYFTKNGSNLAIPWLLMGLSDILDRYDAARGAPLVHYRPKNLD